MKTKEQWDEAEAQTINLASTNKSNAIKLLEGIRGRLVRFPTEFLSETDLSKHIKSDCSLYFKHESMEERLTEDDCFT
jgi:hypothetical protein